MQRQLEFQLQGGRATSPSPNLPLFLDSQDLLCTNPMSLYATNCRKQEEDISLSLFERGEQYNLFTKYN
jgi:hypothetical protein